MKDNINDRLNEVQKRIRRIHAALGVVERGHTDDAGPMVCRVNGGTWTHQDYRAGQSEADLTNQAMSLIHNIANLQDHLKRWANGNSELISAISHQFNGCLELKIVKDLSNRDKHGPSNYGGHSSAYPELVEVNRVMRLQCRSGTVSCEMHLGSDGKWVYTDGATHQVVVTGSVVDQNGNRIGDLYEIALSAVNAWERFATDHGLIQPEPTK